MRPIYKTNHHTDMAIIGLGNALTDILVQLPDESILRELGVERGGMYLIDSRKHQQMMSRIGHLPQSIAAGGSAANMVGGVATLGTPAAYVGHIGADATGEAFRRCQQQKHIKPLLGVSEATPSGKCISMVLPDGERTMLTYLGAALEIDTRELTPENLRGNKVLFIEGYLLNCPDGGIQPVEILKAAAPHVPQSASHRKAEGAHGDEDSEQQAFQRAPAHLFYTVIECHPQHLTVPLSSFRPS